MHKIYNTLFIFSIFSNIMPNNLTMMPQYLCHHTIIKRGWSQHVLIKTSLKHQSFSKVTALREDLCSLTALVYYSHRFPQSSITYIIQTCHRVAAYAVSVCISVNGPLSGLRPYLIVEQILFTVLCLVKIRHWMQSPVGVIWHIFSWSKAPSWL